LGGKRGTSHWKGAGKLGFSLQLYASLQLCLCFTGSFGVKHDALVQKALSLFSVFEYSFEPVFINEIWSSFVSVDGACTGGLPLLDPIIGEVTVGLAVGMAVENLCRSTLVSQSVTPCLASAVPEVVAVLEHHAGAPCLGHSPCHFV
jgi:hypothetical protein